MENAAAEPAPTPSYLAQIEQLAGVRFFADGQLHNVAHTHPEAVPAEIRATYAETYIGGLRLLVTARRECGGRLPHELAPAERQQLRVTHSEEITAIRTQLLEATPVSVPGGATTLDGMRSELSLSRSMLKNIVIQEEPLLVPYRRYAESRTGSLYLSNDGAESIRRAVAEIPVASAENDVAVSELPQQLQTDRRYLKFVCDELGILERDLRTGSTSGRMAPYITRTELSLLQEYYARLEDTTGLQSTKQIASRAGVDYAAVRTQITWHGWDKHYVPRRQRDENDFISTAFYLPDELADIIAAELSVIIPDGYLTIGEYAELRGTTDRAVRVALTKGRLTTHPFTFRERTTAFLDGATMYALDRLIDRKRIQGPRTLRIPQREQPMLSPDTARAAGLTSLTSLVEQTGIRRRSLRSALVLRGLVAIKLMGVSGQPENYYDNQDLARALPDLPKRGLPLKGVNVSTLARLNHIQQNSMITRLAKRGVKAAGSYYTDLEDKPGSVNNYYLKEDVAAAGIKIPATPAFPRGERPYGKYGPARPTPRAHPAQDFHPPTEPLLMEGRPPAGMQSLEALLSTLPEEKRPTQEAAIEFILAHGGEVCRFTGYGDYVLGVSAGLINYNFDRPHVSPQKIHAGWLNRTQLAEATGQPAHMIDADLQALDWGAMRSKLENIRSNALRGGDRPQAKSNVHILWHKPKGSDVTLPHYNPTIVQHIVALAEARRAK